jgi:hypothetical protein
MRSSGTWGVNKNRTGTRRSGRGDGGGDGPTARPMVPLPTGKLKAPARVDHFGSDSLSTRETSCF